MTRKLSSFIPEFEQEAAGLMLDQSMMTQQEQKRASFAEVASVSLAGRKNAMAF